jgi:hypothetical protein
MLTLSLASASARRPAFCIVPPPTLGVPLSSEPDTVLRHLPINELLPTFDLPLTLSEDSADDFR